jgi:AraC family transcriptional regulator, regulatory protein of adaptative response / DNA-3-methyladenine glycosylase II
MRSPMQTPDPAAIDLSLTVPSGQAQMVDDAAYAALSARDTRFDGHFFVGVTSTRIYCRPICRVRVPLKRHCRFFGSAAMAEHHGFRPCLRCRPELAPGLSLMEASSDLAAHAARLLRKSVDEGEPCSMAQVAKRLGVSDRHLRRIFIQAHGVSPLDYLTTQRLLLAKHLLTDTGLAVGHVGVLAGFGSARRFQAAFASHYRMPPQRLRKESHAGLTPHSTPAGDLAPTVRLQLAYRPPFAVLHLWRFLAKRSMVGVEAVDLEKLSLRRTLAVGAHRGWIGLQWGEAKPQTPRRLWLDVSESLMPVVGEVMRRVRHALDLDAQPGAMQAVLAKVPAPILPGLRLPGSFDGFETAVRIVLGQQISVAAACTLANRLTHALGCPLTTPHADLTHLFPTPERLLSAPDDELGRLGIVSMRIRLIKAIAQGVLDGSLDLRSDAPLESTLAAFRALAGVGPWTAEVMAMRVLAWPDAFPASDIGVLNALDAARPDLSNPKQSLTQRSTAAEAQAQAWRPWRAYAVMQLWHTLEAP